MFNDIINKSTQTFDLVSSWEEFKDVIVSFEDASLKSNELLEHTNTTKDKFIQVIFGILLGKFISH